MAALEEIEVGDADTDRLIHRLIGIEHDHRSHQLGHRCNRRDRVGAFGVDRLPCADVEYQRVSRREPQLADVKGHV